MAADKTITLGASVDGYIAVQDALRSRLRKFRMGRIS
jgi:hypothetical protein